jgi:hypothetical protein
VGCARQTSKQQQHDRLEASLKVERTPPALGQSQVCKLQPQQTHCHAVCVSHNAPGTVSETQSTQVAKLKIITAHLGHQRRTLTQLDADRITTYHYTFD